MKAQSLFSAAAMILLCVVANANQSDFGKRTEEQDGANPSAMKGEADTTDSPTNTAADSPAMRSKASESKGNSLTPKKPQGRLPRYFSAVVNPQQRQQIYSVQESFRTKILKLEAELEELRRMETIQIEKLLSEMQLSQVKELRAAAEQRRLAQRSLAEEDTSATR